MRRAFPLRPRWWIAVVQVVLLLATILTPVAAATEPSPMTGAQLIDLLRTYGVVKGDERGNLNLDNPITRAEMITILVRALGGEEDAPLFKGYGIYEDAKGHWAEGYIAYATNKRLIRGDGNGLVRPNDQVSYAEALTMLVRLVNQEPATGDWPYNVLLAAADLKLLPEGVNATTIRQPAIRRAIFQSLALAMTTIPVQDGKTAIQAYLDKEPPLLTPSAVTTPTKDASVPVSGTTKGASSVTVNGKSVNLSVTGEFSTTVDLAYGDNDITLVAVDLAGNSTSKTLKVARILPVARLEVAGPEKVVAGETATYTVTAYDNAGKTVPSTNLAAQVEGNIGSFDVKSGLFTAGTQTATGKITFSIGSVTKSVDVSVLGPSAKVTGLTIRRVNGGQAVSVTKPMVVEVLAVDINGSIVLEDNKRQVSLSAAGTGVSVSPSVTTTRSGVATFTVRGTTTGAVSLVASSIGLNPATDVGTFGTVMRVALRAETTSLVVGSSSATRIWAELLDENGSPVTNNSGSDIYLTLRQSGATGILIDDALTIRRGYSSSTLSGDDGRFDVGSINGVVTLAADVVSSHGYTVDTVNLSITRPTVGSGSKLQALSLNGVLRPGIDTAVFTIRVVDATGNLVRDGSYAFQLQIDTSNNDPKTDGVPNGVSVYLGSTSRVPVYTGSAPTGNFAYARTRDGYATINIGYSKSGEVTVTPILIDTVSTAYDETGALASATSSRNLTAVADRVFFASTAGGLKLTVDSDLGIDQSGGSLPATTSRFFTLRAWVTDSSGAWVPTATGALTLSAETTNATTMPTAPDHQRNAVSGKAEFRVSAKATTGCDRYRVTGNAGAWVSQYVTLCTTNSVPDAPQIVVTRGASGSIAGQPNLVTSVDDRMEMELASQPAARWASAVVYRVDTNTAIYTTSAVDMAEAAPRVFIPKSVLPSGQHYFRVALKNGSGEGAKSANSAVVTIAAAASSANMVSAKYDAGTATATSAKLYVTAYGISRAGTIDTNLLVLRDASTYASGLRLTGAAYTISNDGLFVVDLATVPAAKAILENPALFSGNDVALSAEAGWYYSTNGETARAYADKPVGPFAIVTAVAFDIPNKIVTLTGSGFTTGNVDMTKLSISQGANTLQLSGANIVRADRLSDITINVYLSTVGADQLLDPTKFNGTDVLNATPGWITDGAFRTAAVSGVPVAGKVNVTRVAYTKSVRSGADPNVIVTPAKLTITGSGFFSGMDATKTGSVTRNRIQIVDLDNPAHTLTWSGGGTGISVLSDGLIEITIDDADALVFEDTFSGTNIYLAAFSGWFTDFQGRQANPIPDRYFRLTIN